MTAKTTPAVRDLEREPDAPKAETPASAMPLPHDRDEKSAPPVEDGQHQHNRLPIAQAQRDVEAGLRDTERIGVPNDVPSSRKNAGPRR
jgi:hypothetical protein